MKDGVFIGDRYEVLSKVGSGGMADVYKAKDQKLNRFVAIKILKKEYREDAVFVQKFQSEAQAAAGLMHPNIVNVYDVGEEQGLYYMVMELVEGITLKDYISKKGKLTGKEAISIAIQISNGIEAAHMNQIVHRDIKPQNIIISKEGKVKVTDFGIAKATTSNTISTNAMGSVHYTSPEQARGGFSDFKSDIYSLGITMYEMVTGRVPFNGDTAVSIAIKHLQEEITPPSEFAPDLSYSLEQIILKCTQKSPDNRYQNIGALKNDLKRSLSDPDGKFVVLRQNNLADETIAITSEELDKIKSNPIYVDKEYTDFEDEEEDLKKNSDMNPKMTKAMKILAIVTAVIIIFVMIFMIGKATGLLKFGPGITAEETEKTVSVPDLRGKTVEEAQELVSSKKYDFKIEISEEKKSAQYKKGQIISHTPGRGEKVKKGITVKVVVCSENVSEKVTIADVAGMDQDQAKEELIKQGFKEENISIKFETNSDYPSDQVFSTEPSIGTEATTDSKIVLFISKGKEKPVVPSVTGKTEADARAALNACNLAVTTEQQYHDTVESGKVISQSQSEGSRVEPGTTIHLVISQGKKPEAKTDVPNIIGAGEFNAKNAIHNAGLVWAEGTPKYSDEFAAGEVISCDPAPGTSVKPGTTITVIISLGKEEIKQEQSENNTTPQQ